MQPITDYHVVYCTGLHHTKLNLHLFEKKDFDFKFTELHEQEVLQTSCGTLQKQSKPICADQQCRSEMRNPGAQTC